MEEDTPSAPACVTCGKPGFPRLGPVGLRSVSFCGKACEKLARPAILDAPHRIEREKARDLDKAAADYAADEALAADACRADVPDGALCYICYAGSDEVQGDIVRGCACRGPHAGFVHIRCLVAMAEAKAESDEAYYSSLVHCGQCRQQFHGPVRLALWRSARLRVAGRAETDTLRMMVFETLAGALTSLGRDEALDMFEELLVTSRKWFGPHDKQTIICQQNHCNALLRVGMDDDEISLVLECLGHCVAFWETYEGSDAEEQADIARSCLAAAHFTAGHFEEAALLHAKQWAVCTRAGGVGGADFYSLYAATRLIGALLEIGTPSSILEARDVHDQVAPLAIRVLGPGHFLTQRLRYCGGQIATRVEEIVAEEHRSFRMYVYWSTALAVPVVAILLAATVEWW